MLEYTTLTYRLSSYQLRGGKRLVPIFILPALCVVRNVRKIEVAEVPEHEDS